MFQIELADKIEFFKSTAVWNALGWDLEETCFYWQHNANKIVIRVHCDSLEVATREELSREVTARRGSAKPLAKYLSDRDGAALAVEKLQQSLHLVACLSAKPKTEAQTVKAKAGGSQGGVDVSAGGHGASVSSAADPDRAVGTGSGATSAMPPPLPPIQPIPPLPPQLPLGVSLRMSPQRLGEDKERAAAAEAERVAAAAAQLEALRVEHEASAVAASAILEARGTAMIAARGGDRHQCRAPTAARGGDRHQCRAPTAARGGDRHHCRAPTAAHGGDRHECRAPTAARGGDRGARERSA